MGTLIREHEAPVDRREHTAEDEPMKEPERPPTMLMPSAMPRSSCGKASVRIAAELDIEHRAADGLHHADTMICMAPGAPAQVSERAPPRA